MDAKPMLREGGRESDRELMERLAFGDLEALGDIYERYGPRLRAALAGLAADIEPAEREELLQDVFLAVADAAGSFRGEARLSTWIHAIALRKVRHFRRGAGIRGRIRKRHGAECAGVSRQVGGSPEQSAELREAAFAALSRLPEDEREIVWLHVVEELTADEISRVKGISRSRVWTRLRRARDRLSKAMRRQMLMETRNRGTT